MLFVVRTDAVPHFCTFLLVLMCLSAMFGKDRVGHFV